MNLINPGSAGITAASCKSLTSAIPGMTVPHAEWPNYDSGQHTPQTEKNHQITPRDTCHGSHPDKAFTPSHQAQAGHCPSTQKDPPGSCELQRADPCAELGRLTQPPRRRARPPAGNEDRWNPAMAHLDPARRVTSPLGGVPNS